jgi:hypothetical protein
MFRALFVSGAVEATACAVLAATHGKPVGTFNGCPIGLLCGVEQGAIGE